jgi:hypothetical protein
MDAERRDVGERWNGKWGSSTWLLEMGDVRAQLPCLGGTGPRQGEASARNGANQLALHQKLSRAAPTTAEMRQSRPWWQNTAAAAYYASLRAARMRQSAQHTALLEALAPAALHRHRAYLHHRDTDNSSLH